MSKTSPIEILKGFVLNRELFTCDEHFSGVFERLMDMATKAVATEAAEVEQLKLNDKIHHRCQSCGELAVKSSALQYLDEMNQLKERVRELEVALEEIKAEVGTSTKASLIARTALAGSVGRKERGE